MNIEVSVEDHFMNELMEKLQQTSIDVMRNALAIYAWYISELSIRRVVLSCDSNGNNVNRIIL